MINMRSNTKYVCYIRQKQAYVNRWIGKQMKNYTEEEVHVQQRVLEDSTFSQLLLKDFAETFLNVH